MEGGRYGNYLIESCRGFRQSAPCCALGTRRKNGRVRHGRGVGGGAEKLGSPHLGDWLRSVSPAERAEGNQFHLQENR